MVTPYIVKRSDIERVDVAGVVLRHFVFFFHDLRAVEDGFPSNFERRIGLKDPGGRQKAGGITIPRLRG